jgi:orotidine-5'-phosphate decarboxylase
MAGRSRAARDYLVFPLDLPSVAEARRWVLRMADVVGMFKVGLELFVRGGPDIVRFIHASGAAGVFLDLKLHDIPETVSRAMTGIAELGVRLATVHCGESPRMLEAAAAAAAGRVDVLGVTVLTSVSAADISSAGLAEPWAGDVSRLALRRAQMAKAAGLAGVVCSGLEVRAIKEALGPAFLAVAPGIRPAWAARGRGDDQKRVTTPAEAVLAGADYIVVGRPIRDAADPRAAAERTVAEIAAARP